MEKLYEITRWKKNDFEMEEVGKIIKVSNRNKVKGKIKFKA